MKKKPGKTLFEFNYFESSKLVTKSGKNIIAKIMSYIFSY